jgi:hypothetical protein
MGWTIYFLGDFEKQYKTPYTIYSLVLSLSLIPIYYIVWCSMTRTVSVFYVKQINKQNWPMIVCAINNKTIGVTMLDGIQS